MLGFLHRLGTAGGNDANISQLVFIFAPLLCRPLNSAYMSVRHMEDLRKLRPVLQVLVENSTEILKEVQEPAPTVVGLANSAPLVVPHNVRVGTDETKIIRGKNLFVDVKAETKHHDEFTIVRSGSDDAVISDNSETAFPKSQNQTHKPINYQSKEWNVRKLKKIIFYSL